jgi:hypothetical protein
MFLMLALGAPVRSSRRHCFGEFGPLGCEAEPCLLVEGIHGSLRLPSAILGLLAAILCEPLIHN